LAVHGGHEVLSVSLSHRSVKRGIVLRQNYYNRESKHLVTQQSRYAHARQIKRPQTIHGNPYDGHTLTVSFHRLSLLPVPRSMSSLTWGTVATGYTDDVQIHVDIRRRGRTPRSLRHWMKRRGAVIGHLKREHRMDRNRLKGTESDRINAILCVAGMNFRKLQRFAAAFLRPLLRQYFAVVTGLGIALVIKELVGNSTIRKNEFFGIG